jgi:hypothetical protein
MTKSMRIPDELQARAEKLGLWITVLDGSEQEEGLDFGPFMLSCAVTRKHIWPHALPAEGIADALDCYARERQLPDGADIGAAWCDFGASWITDDMVQQAKKAASSI